jgi:CAAX prenyl protease-like protein
MIKPATLARVLPFAAYMAFIFLADMLERQGVAADTLRLLYPVKILVVVALLYYYRRSYSELWQVGLGARPAVVAVAGGLLVLYLWINLSAGWMSVGQSAGYEPRGADGQLVWWLVAVRLAGAALVVPVMEELFWRSFLLRWQEHPDFQTVTPAHVRIRSFVVTVILFGVEHNLWLAGMVAGVVYGLLYMRSNTLWSPILAHSVTNGLLGGWIIYTGNWGYW